MSFMLDHPQPGGYYYKTTPTHTGEVQSLCALSWMIPATELVLLLPWAGLTVGRYSHQQASTHVSMWGVTLRGVEAPSLRMEGGVLTTKPIHYHNLPRKSTIDSEGKSGKCSCKAEFGKNPNQILKILINQIMG